jgi:hypothetical protein
MFKLETINFNKEFYINIINGSRYIGNDFGFKNGGKFENNNNNEIVTIQ